jgi:hypothetical protein
MINGILFGKAKFAAASFVLFIMIGVAFGDADQPSGSVYSVVPEEPDSTACYVFYLHGMIIENKGVRPAHPQFGVYEYEKILERLAAEGFQVVSEAREKGTDVNTYAEKVASEVRYLLARGVAPDRITVIGFSKGGAIAIFASEKLANRDVNFVFMASCGSWLQQREESPQVSGRILSIYEKSDGIAGSCAGLFDTSRASLETKDIMIDTGKRHGAFYLPRSEWLQPAIEWIKQSGN